jgi:hypothetical protein
MASLLRATVFILLLALTTRSALAQTSSAPVSSTPVSSTSASSPPTAEPEYLDYRLSLAASDLVGFGLLIAAIPAENGWMALGGLGVYALGAPIIHIANEQPARGFASLGMRLLLPIPGAIVGGALGAQGNCGGDDDGFGCLGGVVGGGLLGAFVGGVSAALIDDVFFGKVPLPSAPTEHRVRATAMVAPYVDTSRGTFGLTLSGTF